MRYKLAMFDFNGTLVRDLPIVYEAMSSVFQAHLVTPPALKIFRNTPRVPLEWYYEQGLPKHVSHDEIRSLFSAAAAKSWGTKSPRLRHGTLPLVRACRRQKAKTIIISALNKDLMHERTSRLKLHLHFDEIHGGIEDKTEVILEMLDKHKTKNHESFYVGDTAGDIEAAKRAKIISIAILDGYNTRKVLLAEKPDFVVKSLVEVLQILEGAR